MSKKIICTLTRKDTGEQTTYESLVAASLALGRTKTYLRTSLAWGNRVSDADGHYYDVETRQALRKEINRKSIRQLCFSCKKSSNGCPWSQRFEPVEGWEATPTVIWEIRQGEKYAIESYAIKSCPLYEEG